MVSIRSSKGPGMVSSWLAVHTNSTFESINRIVDVFPSSQQPQIRAQLAQAGWPVWNDVKYGAQRRDDARRAIIARVLERWDEVVAPGLGSLPGGVIHNDAKCAGGQNGSA